LGEGSAVSSQLGADSGREHPATRRTDGGNDRGKPRGRLRHSFISRLANSEVPTDVRKQIVGHSSDDIRAKHHAAGIGPA
jgi:integrase